MGDKKILSIETSGELCSVCLSFNQKTYDERNILMKHIHSEKLIPMIEELFNSNSVTAKDIYGIAISIGPGSFTGLRIGMTAAKGIAFAANLPLIPIPTFHAMSIEISKYLDKKKSFCILNNANIEECYFGRYEVTSDTTEVLEEVKLLKKSDIDNVIKETDSIYGNFLAFEGIKHINSPRASSIAKWAYLFGEDLVTFDYDYLEPNYLKNFKVRHKK